ncbi:killer cell lectin-like receptor subfamily B member 1C [Mixophyes fleayi]|uniref:killer cell lectin-like receptor subfamily B member 1C n=1 Tax=Mixophyes fleayi TaxID=3061075 RepID=UPI003F4D9D24
MGLNSKCPAHWILIDNKCYFFSENKKYYHESVRNCTESGSRLATVKEGGILRLVTITAQEFWIGLTTTGSHQHGKVWTGRWADGSTETITDGTGSCAKIGRRLILGNCYSDQHWICERDTL